MKFRLCKCLYSVRIDNVISNFFQKNNLYTNATKETYSVKCTLRNKKVYNARGYDRQHLRKCHISNINEQDVTKYVPRAASNSVEKDSYVVQKETHDDFDETEKIAGPLDDCTEDLSCIGPYTTPALSLAKYANSSRTIKELINLGVELYKWEKHPKIGNSLLNLDFKKDVKPYIQFLHDCGVPTTRLGNFITKNPLIFKEDMDDLHTRIRYLRAHKFDAKKISTIVCNNPCWLIFSTSEIDERLGFFQHNFRLNGNEVRNLATQLPKLITYNMKHIKDMTFTIKEEMGFDELEVKRILLKAPYVWVKNRDKVMATFDFVHNEMKISHEMITTEANILLCRKSRLLSRHKFLVELGKDQYDPKKPLYISLLTLATGTDVKFCEDVAGVSVELYNLFMKTL